MKISKIALGLSIIDAILVLLAGPLLVFSILMGTAIFVIFLVMGSKGIATSVGVEAFIALIIVVSLVLSVLYIREVK